jgi:hypothetical protein
MIVFSGLGGVSVLFVAVSYGIAAGLCGGWEQMEAARWPFALTTFLNAVFNTLLGLYLRSRPPRVLVDKATGREVTSRYPDTVFFVPIIFWGPIYLLMAMYQLSPHK